MSDTKINKDTLLFPPSQGQDILQAVLLLGFFFPLFIQLSGQVFHEAALIFNAKGNVLETPLPIAIPICFIAIILCYRFENRHFGMGLVFSFFITLLLSMVLSTNGEKSAEFSKFLLLTQFVLPLFAFILGKLYQPPKSDFFTFEAVAVYVLVAVLPLWITSTFMLGLGPLSADLFVFSLYQHIEYLPTIFMSFYFLGAVCLHHDKWFRTIIMLLAPLVGILGSASIFFSAIVILLGGSVLLIVLVPKKRFYKFATFLLIWGAFFAYQPLVKNFYTGKLYTAKETVQVKTPQNSAARKEVANQDPTNWRNHGPNFLLERTYIWEFYTKGIFSNLKTFLFGHSTRLDRQSHPSAHNYYLDLIYNFGLVAFLPFIYLIGVTLTKSYRHLKTVRFSRGLVMLGFLVCYFIFIDNSFKTGFRQPYPGMVMFFLWGVYLQRLDQQAHVSS